MYGRSMTVVSTTWQPCLSCGGLSAGEVLSGTKDSPSGLPNKNKPYAHIRCNWMMDLQVLCRAKLRNV